MKRKGQIESLPCEKEYIVLVDNMARPLQKCRKGAGIRNLLRIACPVSFQQQPEIFGQASEICVIPYTQRDFISEKGFLHYFKMGKALDRFFLLEKAPG